MDLKAYANTYNEKLSNYIEKNYGEIPRCRGYELMKLAEKYGDDSDEQTSLYNSFVGQDVIYIHTRCGKCGEDTRVNLTHPLYKIYTTGASIDQNEDFEDWSIEDIRDRIKLVQDFDRLCDNCLAALKNLINNTEIVEEEYVEVKTKKTLKNKEV